MAFPNFYQTWMFCSVIAISLGVLHLQRGEETHSSSPGKTPTCWFSAGNLYPPGSCHPGNSRNGENPALVQEFGSQTSAMHRGEPVHPAPFPASVGPSGRWLHVSSCCLIPWITAWSTDAHRRVQLSGLTRGGQTQESSWDEPLIGQILVGLWDHTRV